MDSALAGYDQPFVNPILEIFMKFLILSLAAFTSLSASAATFRCGMTDLTSGKTLVGNSTQVKVSEDGMNAGIYDQAIAPNAEERLSFQMNLEDADSRTYKTGEELQDLTVSFRLSPRGKAGVLKYQSPGHDGTRFVSQVQMYLCERQ